MKIFGSVKIFFAIFFFLPVVSSAQDQFNVTLRLDFSSVDALIELSEGRIANIDRVAELKGNQIAAATSALLAREPYSTKSFARELERFRNGASLSNDIYGLSASSAYLQQIKELVKESKRRNLDRRVLSTIAPFFPSASRINAFIPVYFVALGNENAAAFVRSVVWRDNVPYFVRDGEGELTIVVNLTRSVQFLNNVEYQFVDMLSTLAHESFHAVFGVYQQSSSAWRMLNAKPEPVWTLAELAQNEGIAYLISLQQRSGGQMSPDRLVTARRSITALGDAMKELSSPDITHQRATELIMNSNLSGSYEKNYGATAGLMMAYMIDQKLGRKALTETLQYGTGDFFAKYQQVADESNDLPKFDPAVISFLQK
ncbi:MAG: DUF5700 domain-containing putative Zn-dependent protease [Bacteroidota bacterium]